MLNVDLVGVDSLDNPEVVKIDWFIGKRCNYDCTYCSPDLHDNYSTHLSLSQFISAANNFIKVLDPKLVRINFGGGEPTVNPNFIDFCKYLKNIDISFTSVTSNGTRTVGYYTELLQYINSISFSQHFEHSNIYEFTKKIIAISTLYSKVINVQVMFNANYFEEAKESIKIYKDNNIRYTLRRIRDSFTSSNAHVYSDEQLAWFFSEQPHENSSKNTIILYKDKNNIKSLPVHVNEISSSFKNKFKGWSCWAGIYTLTVWNDNMLYRGSCQEGGAIASIYDEEINLPTEPIRCNKEICVCAPEISVRKIKNTDEQWHVMVERIKNK